ncbi:DUF2570 domain-containing protein [Citrobacter sp. wls718]|uniref:DUF2570 domain-containing protein n=1 Tax=Citrobacter sp. wls718 TaxID=2576418 RepID=UPI000DF9C1A1|nr:DUF2570 domain-containing protein [Citrobacter sp. wls718]TKU26443.1 DUF2570 domain-containing protein [Citrobacter sp. wls718]STE16813.1 putative Rz lytic protein [Escherichia coli]
MTFGDKAIAIGAVIAIGVGCFVWVNVEKTHSENVQLRKELLTETQARNTAEWLLHSQEQTIQIFSAIRVANAAARREDERLRDEAQNQITLILEKDECAKRDVPAAAVEWLQRVETRARSGGGDPAAY